MQPGPNAVFHAVERPALADDTAAVAMVDAVYRRVSWRILPLLVLGYMLAYVDRVNISFAKLQMQPALSLSEAAYGFGAGVFFLGYVLLEVPSNLLLARIGARRTLSRIMVLWGATSIAMVLVRTEGAFYALRFLLGAFEAGFGPGMLFYLTLWYGPARRGRIMALVLLAGPLASVIGGPLSTSVMTGLDGRGGLAGWQWLFLVEGLPCLLVAVLLFLRLDDAPASASWLGEAERTIVVREAARGDAARQADFAAALRDPVLYGLALAYGCMIAGLYAISFWLPTLLRSAGVRDLSGIGVLTSLPYAGAIAAMLLVTRHSDRTQERFRHCAVPCLVGAAALALTAFTLDELPLSLGALVVATCGIYAAYAVFWTIPAERLRGTAAAGGMALINSIGLLGGFLSPIVIGTVRTWTGSLQGGLSAVAGALGVGGLLILAIRRAASPDASGR